MYFSIIIPVYNRPQELYDLLLSLTKQSYKEFFEVVVVEDGSVETSQEIVNHFKEKLNVQYYSIENSGAGLARNYGMRLAKGDYFIILDSDVILPTVYLESVSKQLNFNYSDAFGGPDAAHASFTNLQKAINYSMTSFLTTGGIRGGKQIVGKFQPRSFNMGLSKKVFLATGGFDSLIAGEDIDLTFRIWKQGFSTQRIKDAFVYHKRRVDLHSFFKQTFSFGKARPLLNKRYPATAKISYWFPSCFLIGFLLVNFLLFYGYWEGLILYYFYFSSIFLTSLWQNKNTKVAFLSVITTLVQMMGYGSGFMLSKLNLFKNKKLKSF